MMAKTSEDNTSIVKTMYFSLSNQNIASLKAKQIFLCNKKA